VDRYKLIILLFLFIASPVHAGMMMMTGDGTSAAACTDANPVGNCTGFLICQNFETTAEDCDPCTEDNSESWDKTIPGEGTITVDYGTALRGSQSLRIVSNGAYYYTIKSPSFTAQDTIYGFLRIKIADGRPATTNELVHILDGDGTVVGKVSVMTTGVVRVYNGTTYSVSTTALPDGATGTYYIWFYWSKDPDSSDTGTMGVAVSDTRTFVEWEDEDITGTADTQATSIMIRDRYIQGVVADQVLIKTTAIGTVCE
jgi:hypothetical protein